MLEKIIHNLHTFILNLKLKMSPVELSTVLDSTVGRLTFLSLHGLATYLHLTLLQQPLKVKRSAGIHARLFKK